MFIDYYAILEVGEQATQDEIKYAFRKQALKWHPDRNIGIDTTNRMQEINEAYLILKDVEARARYDNEYQGFKQYKEKHDKKQYHNKNEQYQSESTQSEQAYSYTEYQSNDEILNKWMNNAKQQAVTLAKQTIEDFRGMVSVGAKAAAKEVVNQFIAQIIIGIVILIFVAVKSCNN